MHSSTDKNLAEQLSEWNPMRDAYNDSKFNKYNIGPGADLEDSLQPSELSKQSTKQNNPYLVFKQVPANLTLMGLINICSGYGKVLRGNQRDKGMFFVNFATINDMERVFTRLQNNPYGFTVMLGKDKNKEGNHMKSNEQGSALMNLPPFPRNQIDHDRSYQISSRNPPRPNFNKRPFVSKEDYENNSNLLNLVDPQRHFLIENDAFDLERVSYSKQNTVTDGWNYYTGRAYYVMPEKEKRFIESKRKTTDGSYRHEEEKFVKPSPDFEQVKVGPCGSCQIICDIVCSRCSEFFCSVECQKKEWQKHRYVCGKPPFMLQGPEPSQSAVSSNKTLPSEESEQETPIPHDSTQRAALKSQLPVSGQIVMLTAISKTNVVFVRSKAHDDNLKFFHTVSIIQKEATSQRPLLHTPQRGEIVLTKFKENQYNRAMILDPDDLDHIKLIYIDYGNIDSKSLDQLYNAPDQFWHLPRMAVPIVLKGVPDFFMTDEVKKYMFAHLNTDMKIEYDEKEKDNWVHVAELFTFDSNLSYNQNIASFRGPPAELNKTPVLYKEYLEHLPLPMGENVELIIMDNSLLQTAFVSCTTEAYAFTIQKFQDEIQKYIKDTEDTVYTPRVNELCLAQYAEDNQWYRGRCIEVVGDGHPSILFLDYGNISVVSVENIRKYPEEFSVPLMTGDCEIIGLPETITDEVKRKLEDALQPGARIVCDKVEKVENDDSYSIHLNDIVKKCLT